MSDSTILSLLESARYEVLPTSGIAERISDSVDPGRVITVTASTGLTLEATLATAEQLQSLGFTAVPHVAARMVHGRSELAEVVDRLRTAGITRIFVPAGDATPPAGDYSGALDLLVDLSGLDADFLDVDVAAYPESHPLISDEVTIQAMADKRGYASHLVSNLCFDPDTVESWLHAVRRRGIDLPVHLGVAGKVELGKLAKVATKIGVGESTKFLRKNVSTFARMAKPGGYNPRKFLDRLAPVLDDPALGVAGLHIYTFNQIKDTEEWRRKQVEKLSD
ncbi:methylenetetrahydrofolate reductase (NADPH) [Brevibacterium sanguinis]|uniref:Methylenetetrahydrofolate reductase n=2 Tax=Brevibacterium TaxID=1696 RepID=A0A366IJ00_9MICO|nr:MULTISPECIES: methylenetetrahydrofolate reductase [Brevibacterium]RBP62237.1 methylenetetrahydrofolate reductase (NADPH) [Brevibacterium sanguinis]RBP70631.1 methylenetetrahydrofolate reductase (NADPH) [Brevibacterium celere]